jgi:hypothetical protein
MLTVPSCVVENRLVVSTGKRVRTATIHDEEWISGTLLHDPIGFIAKVRESPVRADIFSFAHKFFDCRPRHPFRFAWDNVAAIPTSTFSDWWERRVSHDLRKDVKRAEKRGIKVRRVAFDDQLVVGIKDLYDEVPFRQGRRFWHYGKDVATIRRENETYLDRAEFIGAYLHSELVGFIKIVYVDDNARMMQILAKERHQDKRPMNALIAKAVELACERNCSYLTYGKFAYDGRQSTSIALFKRRNGFEEIRFPRYYIPLTTLGILATCTGLHLGVKRFIPDRAYSGLRALRAKLLLTMRRSKQTTSCSEAAATSTMSHH